MSATASTAEIVKLRSLIEAVEEITAFTGAGVSTESGVPDFRSPGSPWRDNMPIDFAQFLASPEARVEAWRRKFAMDDQYASARPSRGHYALARLASEGRIGAIITQNVDNLHQVAGTPEGKLIELHGNGSYAKCLSCGRRVELAEVRAAFERTGEPPVCAACGGLIKSATISFGQAMPENEMARAKAAALSCDLFLAIGTSLVVYPAAGFPQLAKRNGARLVILNRDPTPLDHIADLVVRSDIGDALAPWATN
jgi:NAD-dependent deacetylase